MSIEANKAVVERWVAVTNAKDLDSLDELARAASFRPEIDLDDQTSRVLVEQLGAVDASRLGDLSGHLSPEELWSVDEALSTVLGLGLG